MSSNNNNGALIVEVPRGPSIAGTRITIYSILDLIKANWSNDLILQHMPITAEQLDAVYDYIAAHREEVERDYARIVQRSEELRAYYNEQNQARSPFPADMPWETRLAMMRQKATTLKAAQERNGTHDLARS